MNLLFHALGILLVFLLHADTLSESASTKDPCKLHRGSCADQAKDIKAISEKAAEKNQPEEILDPQIVPSLKEWSELELVERGKALIKGYQELTRVHGLSYSPQVLTCKAYNESTFDLRAKASSSSASGLAQTTKSTCRDLFTRGDWFSSKVAGFEQIKNGATYYAKMKSFPLAQMEIGLAILHQKFEESNPKNLKTALKRYRGDDDPTINETYAKRILNCEKCLIGSSAVTIECLNKAKPPQESK
ncbi:MAG: hypothetical protein IPL83_12480 [Bdellovibrionales bacterium]|nr:hypothetical protein [Bdellovibrionales bacterium]